MVNTIMKIGGRVRLLKSKIEQIVEEGRANAATDLDEMEVPRGQIAKLKDFECLERLALTMEKISLNSEDPVVLTWSRDEALRIAGVLHRYVKQLKCDVAGV